MHVVEELRGKGWENGQEQGKGPSEPSRFADPESSVVFVAVRKQRPLQKKLCVVQGGEPLVVLAQILSLGRRSNMRKAVHRLTPGSPMECSALGEAQIAVPSPGNNSSANKSLATLPSISNPLWAGRAAAAAAAGDVAGAADWEVKRTSLRRRVAGEAPRTWKSGAVSGSAAAHFSWFGRAGGEVRAVEACVDADPAEEAEEETHLGIILGLASVNQITADERQASDKFPGSLPGARYWHTPIKMACRVHDQEGTERLTLAVFRDQDDISCSTESNLGRWQGTGEIGRAGGPTTEWGMRKDSRGGGPQGNILSGEDTKKDDAVEIWRMEACRRNTPWGTGGSAEKRAQELLLPPPRPQASYWFLSGPLPRVPLLGTTKPGG
ncbi:hypothetical protein BDK51DRAFT_26575 [Blyttiomyces helicus]|uniref:Uncharacterized protein n=1 Tax=Blyttiomyces helicus TaxID=388810 RepID=A0A4P9W838_9FUNG|nr:hypothetical protein BDK51DRAFT_26575 [Blyttiomyces helicus]|eukprot:RKO86950.1 hypothetical protein BDK51DRAFT_26575 [Blyttiomyces helicus]